METFEKNLSLKTKVFSKNGNFVSFDQKVLARKLSAKISSLHIHMVYPDLDTNSIRLFLRTMNNIRSCLKSFLKKTPINFKKPQLQHQKTSNISSQKTVSSKDIMAAKSTNKIFVSVPRCLKQKNMRKQQIQRIHCIIPLLQRSLLLNK